jgi:hypothetical protein
MSGVKLMRRGLSPASWLLRLLLLAKVNFSRISLRCTELRAGFATQNAGALIFPGK